MDLFNECCLERMAKMEDKSVDLIFCDLPYGQTSCEWDTCIDLERFWREVKRIRKDTTPIVFTTTTKFGVDLIMSNRAEFRHDYVWKKSKAVGFLNAKKMRMTIHEMVYVFYKKLPKYNVLEYHTHKFKGKNTKKTTPSYFGEKGGLYGDKVVVSQQPRDSPLYEPPLPNSIINTSVFNGATRDEPLTNHYTPTERKTNVYDPPLPTSVLPEENCKYDITKNVYGGGTPGRIKISKNKHDHQQKYDPPLPTSVLKEEKSTPYTNDDYPAENVVLTEEQVLRTQHTTIYGTNTHHHCREQKNGESIYDPPLPNSYLEIKSEGRKHATQKPVALMEFFIKYFTDPNALVLDPTMGSGSTGVACKNLNRRFIGIELDPEIFKTAEERLS